jgi:hypothetical protein
MAEKKDSKTKHKVDLISSQSDTERENNPLAAYSLEGGAVSDPYNTDRVPSSCAIFLQTVSN